MKRVLTVAVGMILLYAVPAGAFESGTRMDGMEITVAPGYSLPFWSGWAGWGESVTRGGISFVGRIYLGSFIIGDDIELDYGAEAGYIPIVSWDYTTSAGDWSASYSIIPIVGQVRYRFGEPGDEAYWYATSGLGLIMRRWSWEQPVWNWDTGEYEQRSDTETSTGAGLTAGFGYKMPPFDFNIGYRTRYSGINLNAGFSF